MKKVQAKKRMVYTPKCHIPIGEAVKTESGEYAIRIKRSKGDEVEVVPIGALMTEVAKTAETSETK